MKFLTRLRPALIMAVLFLLVAAGIAYGGKAGPFNTSGGFLGGNIFTLTASGTNTATYIGKDAAGAADTTYDTTGAGAIIVGSADVTSIVVTTDGGSVTLDGSVNAGTSTITSDLFVGVTATTIDATGAALIHIGSADVTTLTLQNNGALVLGATATTDSVAINSAGTVTIEATGAITIGDASATATTIATDGVGDSEVVLPENSIGPDEIAGLLTMNVELCGELDENSTTYMGPHITDHWLEVNDSITDGSIGGTLCDGLESGTEGTADAPLPGLLGYKVLGLFCKIDGTLASSETVVFTVRSAAADLTPSVTCSLAEAETSCVGVTGSTTDIASGATIAVKAVMVSNNSDDNAWCRVVIAPKAGAV